MSNIAVIENPGVIAGLATHYGMNKEAFVQTMKATIMPNGSSVSNEQIAAFCLVAKEHKLNPFTKEIYAFPGRNGGIQPVVSVDGWMKLINSHPQFDGMGFVDDLGPEGQLISVTCKMHRKDRQHPVEVTEYMTECRRNTDTWKQWPARMLRHKAAIQASRYAFGFAGIMEPDEAERMNDATLTAVESSATVIEDRKAKHDEALGRHQESIDYIKDRIEAEDWQAMGDEWNAIPQNDQMDLWLATTKGGVFSTHERKCIKEKIPRQIAEEVADAQA